MSFNLRDLVSSVKVENGCFKAEKDKLFSEDLYPRHSLQSMLEEASGFIGKTVPKSTKDAVAHYMSVLVVLIDNSPDEWISTFIYGFNHPETFSLCVKCLRTLAKIAGLSHFPLTNLHNELMIV